MSTSNMALLSMILTVAHMDPVLGLQQEQHVIKNLDMALPSSILMIGHLHAFLIPASILAMQQHHANKRAALDQYHFNMYHPYINHKSTLSKPAPTPHQPLIGTSTNLASKKLRDAKELTHVPGLEYMLPSARISLGPWEYSINKGPTCKQGEWCADIRVSNNPGP